MTTKPTLIAAILAVLCSAPAMAKLSDSAGFSGEVSLSAGYTSSTSNFNTSGNAVITDNTTKGESDSGFLPFPLGSVAYTFGRQLDKQVYLGTSREDIAIGTVALEVGFKQQLANGTVVDISFLPTIMSGETWANPYQENVVRTTTDESGNAYRLRLGNIASSGLTLDLAYAAKDIDNELSGQGLTSAEQDLLKRDATSLYGKASYRLFLSRSTFLVPSVTYIKTDADGDANSNTSWAGELSLFQVFGRHQFALTGGYTTRSYDASHPIYDTVRSDDELSLFAAYEFQQLFGWRNLSLISFAGYGQQDSNINFFDEDQMIVSAGVNYKF